MDEIVNRIKGILSESKNMKNAISRLEKELSDRKDIVNVIKLLLNKLISYVSSEITRELRFLYIFFRDESIRVLEELIKLTIRQIGSIELFIVNREAFFSKSSYEAKIKPSELLKYLPKLSSLKFISIIACRRSFLDNLIAVKKIFKEIFQRDPEGIIAYLAADLTNQVWPKLETFLIQEIMLRPALADIIPLIHSIVEEKNKSDGLLFLEDMIRKLCLAVRSWRRSIVSLKRIEKLVDLTRNMDRIYLILFAFHKLNKNEISVCDCFSLILTILPISDLEKKTLLISNGCVPSEKLLDALKNDKINVDEAATDVAKALMDAEKKWAPEVSIAELLGISWLAYLHGSFLKEWLQKKIEENVNKFTGKMPEFLLDLLKIALILSVYQVNCKHDDCSLIVRMLYAVRKRFVEYPLVHLAMIAEALRNLDSDSLSVAIYLQRILEIHGQIPYLYIMDKLYKDTEKIYVVALQTMISSRLGIIAKKTISLAMKNTNALRIVNDLLRNTNFKPHGITAPLLWELAFPPSEKLIEITRYAIRYFEDGGVAPNELLINLHELLKIYPRVTEIKDALKRGKLEELLDAYIAISQFSALLNDIREDVRRIFGYEESPLLIKCKTLILNYEGMINDSWERAFLAAYSELIRREEKFVFSIMNDVKQYYSQDYPIILLIIDGLRIDDYLVKMRKSLESRGFKPIYETQKFSLLPSITAISRRSIFGGKNVFKIFCPIPAHLGEKIQREEDLLRLHFGSSTLYLHGAVRHIINLISRLEKDEKPPKVVAVVLSELEKAAHGAAEGFLAHISLEYAIEVARLAEMLAKVLKTYYDNPPILVLCSDHGLGLFTKITDTNINNVLLLLKKKEYIDPAHEPYVTERYAVIPLLGKELSVSAKSLIEVEFKGEIHALLASELGMEKVALKVRKQNAFDAISADNVVILFPRGRRRFITGARKKRRVVLHGGPLPVETIVPFAIFKYEE